MEGMGEFLDRVARMYAPDAIRTEVIRLDHVDPYAYMVHNRQENKCERFPKPLEHISSVTTLESLVLLLNQWVKRLKHFSDKYRPEDIAVFVGRRRVQVMPVDTPPVTIKMDMATTGACQAFQNDTHWYTQKAFIELLRVVLGETDGQLLEAARHLKIATGGSMESEHRHGKESMGNTINQEVTSSPVPEEWSFKVKLLDCQDAPEVEIKCLIDVDMTGDGKAGRPPHFRIAVIDGQMDEAWNETLNHLADIVEKYCKQTELVKDQLILLGGNELIRGGVSEEDEDDLP